MSIQYETEQARYAAKCASGMYDGLSDDEIVRKESKESSKKIDAFYVEIGTYEESYMQICELCGHTFYTKNEEQVCCQTCVKSNS